MTNNAADDVTLNGLGSRIRISNELSDSFVIKKGLRQSDALSNLLFNVALASSKRFSAT